MTKTALNPENPAAPSHGKAVLDPRWIVKIEGRDFVTYPGLLDLGHQKGIESIEVEPLQLPNDQNAHFAVCKAVVMSKDGETFTDIGDANPGNCSKLVSRHLLRMASTRAIARALRTFTNIGMTCLEELDGDFHGQDQGAGASKPQARRSSPRNTSASPPSRTTQPGENTGVSPAMSDSQRRAVWAISRRQGYTEEQVNAMTVEMFNRELSRLTVSEASSLISHLQSAQAAA